MVKIYRWILGHKWICAAAPLTLPFFILLGLFAGNIVFRETGLDLNILGLTYGEYFMVYMALAGGVASLIAAALICQSEYEQHRHRRILVRRR